MCENVNMNRSHSVCFICPSVIYHKHCDERYVMTELVLPILATRER